MCTVSIFLTKGKLLLTANRDESRKRGEDGLKQFHHNDIHSVYPLDSKAKGTWLGVNNHAIVAAILNMYQADYQGSQSRGFIIPELLKYKSLSQACNYLHSVELNLYSPFVLLLMNRTNVYRYRWNGVSMQKENLFFVDEFTNGILESSSSVDPDATISYRQLLFKQWQQNKQARTNKEKDILEFHLTRDESKPSASICMSRPHAHTKSICQIVLNKNAAEFHYLAPEKLDALVNTTLSETELNALESIKFKLYEIKSEENLSNNICSL